MIDERFLCDSNVWVALALSGHPYHALAREWFSSTSAPASILFCRFTQHTFLRLMTSAAVFAPFGRPPLTNEDAWAVYEAFIEDARITLRTNEPFATSRFWREYTSRPLSSPKLWMDAYLAAFARAAGCQLVTLDNDFRQFTNLELVLLGSRRA
jgi:toxin-antitoxin system PIN domain toxin